MSTKEPVMHALRHRHALLGAAFAVLAAGVAAVLFLVFSADARAEPTRAQYFAQVAAICRVYGPQLDRIRPPDVSGPENVVVAVVLALPSSGRRSARSGRSRRPRS